VLGSNPDRVKIFLSSPEPSGSSLEPGLPPIWLVPGFFPGREIDHLPKCSAEVRNKWSCTSTPPICLRGVERDSFVLFGEMIVIDDTERTDSWSAVTQPY
jgi:hypothetical protein